MHKKLAMATEKKENIRARVDFYELPPHHRRRHWRMPIPNGFGESGIERQRG